MHRSTAPGAQAFDGLPHDWQRLSLALNELHRSMGLPDAYPFALFPLAVQKLEFVLRVIRGFAQAAPPHERAPTPPLSSARPVDASPRASR